MYVQINFKTLTFVPGARPLCLPTQAQGQLLLLALAFSTLKSHPFKTAKFNLDGLVSNVTTLFEPDQPPPWQRSG